MADLRVTRPRLGVLRAVQANPHADTESIFVILRAGLPDVSRQTVYDVLHTLTEVGLLRRFQPSGSAARYETRVGDNHHHFVCRGCGAIADVDCPVGETPCLIPSDEYGFLLDKTEVIYWGFCQTCSGGAVTKVAAPTAPAQTCRDHTRDHKPGYFVSLGTHGQLVDHGVGALTQPGQQMGQVSGRSAAQRFAVEGDHSSVANDAGV